MVRRHRGLGEEDVEEDVDFDALASDEHDVGLAAGFAVADPGGACVIAHKPSMAIHRGIGTGARALQQNASAVVSRAAGGEVIEVTDRGRPVATLGPLQRSALDELVEAGLARPARRRWSDLGSGLVAHEWRVQPQ